jgi:hypothetical protein
MLWSFKDSSWEQDERAKSFKIQSIFGQKCDTDPAAPLGLLIGAKQHPVTGVSCGLGVYPFEFKHCPFCGSPLLDTPDTMADSWIPPYGSGNGLKLFPMKPVFDKRAGLPDTKSRQVALPSRDGRFAFCSTKLFAQQRLLVALQRDSGQLWVFRQGEEQPWKALAGKAGGDTLPVWSWSLAADGPESGLCIPTDQGPAWITVNWGSSSLQVDRAAGRSVGGAVRVGQYLLAPVLREEDFAVVCRKEGAFAWSDCSAISDPAQVLPQLRRTPDQEAFLGIPVVDENKLLAYWPCRGGYVRVSVGDSSTGLTWELRPWETDTHPATALLELGPPYRRTGTRSGFWQLCEDRDPSVRDGIVNKIIKFDGDELIDSEVVKCGQFLTTGRASFSWGDDYWNDIHKHNSRLSEQVELRFPLLQFGENGQAIIAKLAPWDGRDELGVFSDIFFNRALKATSFVRFVVEGAGVPEKALYVEGVDGVPGGTAGSLFRVKVAELPEISAFVYGDAMYLYFPETNDCYSWPLELLEG